MPAALASLYDASSKQKVIKLIDPQHIDVSANRLNISGEIDHSGHVTGECMVNFDSLFYVIDHKNTQIL